MTIVSVIIFEIWAQTHIIIRFIDFKDLIRNFVTDLKPLKNQHTDSDIETL